MNGFDIAAILTIDSSQFDRGLAKAKGAATSFGSGVGGVLGKVGRAAKIGFAAAGVASVGFAATAAKTGANFDKAMSQVAATMGKTNEELSKEVGSVDTQFGHFSGTIRDFAKYMGKNTKFSATQAADALNYMALAGYDTQKSMNMLPNVLNLAAAGNMGLAEASDMVTDAQSALGLSTKETTELVDKMAMAASKSNTSVSQLGEAILTVGGTAKNLKGGTTELAQALGILADNGIKGSEGVDYYGHGSYRFHSLFHPVESHEDAPEPHEGEAEIVQPLVAQEEVECRPDENDAQPEHLHVRREGDQPCRGRGSDVRADDDIDRLRQVHEAGRDESDHHDRDDRGRLDDHGGDHARADGHLQQTALEVRWQPREHLRAERAIFVGRKLPKQAQGEAPEPVAGGHHVVVGNSGVLANEVVGMLQKVLMVDGFRRIHGDSSFSDSFY